MRFLKFLVCLLPLSAMAWEDHPDLDNHKETDRIYKAAQKQTGADKYEDSMRDEQGKKDLEKFQNKMRKNSNENK
jgi:hypothetical protein